MILKTAGFAQNESYRHLRTSHQKAKIPGNSLHSGPHKCDDIKKVIALGSDLFACFVFLLTSCNPKLLYCYSSSLSIKY